MTVFLILCLIIFIVAMGCLYRHFHRSEQSSDKWPSDKWLGISLAVLLPLVTLLGYLTIGSPEAIRIGTQGDVSNQVVDDEASPAQALTPEKIQSAIIALEKETSDNPRDINKLVMLANSYSISQQFVKSAAVWDKIVKLDDSAETLLRAADAHSFANQGAVNATAQDLIERALKLAPQNPQGLWMAGMSAVQKGNLVEGKAFWQQLYPLLANQPEQQKELASLMSELDVELGVELGVELDNGSAKQTAIANSPSITIKVSLDPSVLEQVSPTDIVFVFARAEPGPIAPLAVKRLTVADLPATVTITEQDAMMPQMTIKSFPKIKISAKVSKSGNPTVREGDINSADVILESLDSVGEQILVIGK